MPDGDDRPTLGQTLSSMTPADQAHAAQGLIGAAQLEGFPRSPSERQHLRQIGVDVLEARPYGCTPSV